MNTNRLAVCKENITAFVRRFPLLERKLEDNSVPTYPQESCVIKLLDGLRLDERATAQLLLAAGNKFEMRAILDAIKIQYPAGMSVAGLPNSMHGKKASIYGSRRSQKSARRNWNTYGEDDYEANYDYDETAMPNVPEETYENEDEQNQEYEQNYDDVVYDEGTAFAATLTLLDGLGNSMWPMATHPALELHCRAAG